MSQDHRQSYEGGGELMANSDQAPLEARCYSHYSTEIISSMPITALQSKLGAEGQVPYYLMNATKY